MSQKIDFLTIHGFQSIRSLEKFEMRDLNVLIGANGAGKSNFVNYFRMLSALVEQRLQVWVSKQGGSDRLLTFGVKETSKIYSKIEFAPFTYSFRLEPTIDVKFIFTEEDASTGFAGIKMGTGGYESELNSELWNSKAMKKLALTDLYYQSLLDWKVFHFHDTSETAGVKRYGALHDNRFLRPDASNLAAYLYFLKQKHEQTYQQIRKTVQLAIPFFDDFALRPDRLNEDQIRLMWQQKDSDYEFLASQLSDGSIRFICLVTALLQPDLPSTMIIDEPELGLHPYAITLLGALMRSASQRTQLIVSTQSVPLLNEFAIEDLIVVERENGVSIFKRLEKSDFELWLEEYTVGELWEKNILGGRPA